MPRAAARSPGRVAYSLDDIAPDGMNGRRQPEQQSSQKGNSKAEEQYRNVQRDLDLGRNSGSRRDTGKQFDAGVGKQTPGSRAEQSKHQALGQQLPDDAPLSRSQRNSDRDLFLARGSASKQHVGGIAAGDQQQDADSCHERVKHATKSTIGPLSRSLEDDCESLRI